MIDFKKSLLSELIAVLIVIVVIVSLACCDSNLNTVADPNFTEDGYLVNDTLTNDTADIYFKTTQPSKVTVYVEVSGSMNGFFRANLATQFKTDLYAILTYYRSIISDVVILTNSGEENERFTIEEFQRNMNAGTFVSSAETKVPTMLSTILSKLHPETGEVAVLVSDMKYSPEKDPTRAALMEEYSSDISKVIAPSKVAVSLIAAISNYLDKSGQIIEKESPYYFLVMGASETAGYMRTGISTLLDDEKRYVDCFETGYDYKSVRHSFESSKQALQLDKQPTFYGWNPSDDDTCTLKMNLDLSEFRWITADTAAIRKALTVKAKYGSNVEIGTIEVKCENSRTPRIERKAEATVELKITNIPTESDVIEWQFNHPDDMIAGMNRFFGATTETEYDKSYSIEGFIRGLTYGDHQNSWSKKPSYILISTKE